MNLTKIRKAVERLEKEHKDINDNREVKKILRDLKVHSLV